MEVPKKTTPEGEKAELVLHQRREFCDLVIERAVALMAESGASVEMLTERMLTHTTVHAAAVTPRERLAQAFRQHVKDIERGVFHRPTAPARRQH